MQSLIISLNAVFPVFIMILLGMLLKAFKLLNDTTVAQLNKLVFAILLPTLLFKNIYEAGSGNIIHLRVFIYCLAGIIILWGIVTFFVCLTIKKPEVRGAVIQGASRGNFLLFGLPIAMQLVSGTGFGIISMIVAFAVPLVNLLSVITLEIFKKEKIDFIRILKGIITNPIIIGSILALLFLFMNLSIPKPVFNVIDAISVTASPIGLIVMGAALKFYKIKGNRTVLSISVFTKLIIFPTIGIVVAILIGFRNEDLMAVLIIFAAPTAISSYAMAVEMKSDSDLACQIIVFTTMFACFTNFGFIFLLSYLGFI